MIVPYVASEHEAMVRAWKEGWGLSWRPQDLPPRGWVYDNVVALWMLTTDTNRCQVDSIVGDPKGAKEARRAGMVALGARAKQEAKDLGYAYLEGYTSREGVKYACAKNAADAFGAYVYFRGAV